MQYLLRVIEADVEPDTGQVAAVKLLSANPGMRDYREGILSRQQLLGLVRRGLDLAVLSLEDGIRILSKPLDVYLPGPLVLLSLLDSNTKTGAYTTKDNVGNLPPIDWADNPKDMRGWSMFDVMLWFRVIDFQQKQIA